MSICFKIIKELLMFALILFVQFFLFTFILFPCICIHLWVYCIFHLAWSTTSLLPQSLSFCLTKYCYKILQMQITHKLHLFFYQSGSIKGGIKEILNYK